MTSLERCNSVNDMTGHNVFILFNILITRYQTFYLCVLHVKAIIVTQSWWPSFDPLYSSHKPFVGLDPQVEDR